MSLYKFWNYNGPELNIAVKPCSVDFLYKI